VAGPRAAGTARVGHRAHLPAAGPGPHGVLAGDPTAQRRHGVCGREVQRRTVVFRGRRRRRGRQQRVARQHREPLPQRAEQRRRRLGVRLAAGREGGRRLAGRAAAPKGHRHAVMGHGAGLAHPPLVEAHEVAVFACQREAQRLVPAQARGHRVEQRKEPVDHRRTPPPKTSTPRNSAGGQACPTRMSCAGSPLPQKGVPSTCRSSAVPTATNARQKDDETPR